MLARLPRAGWLAGGGILAALLVPHDPAAPSIVILLGAVASAGLLIGGTAAALGRRAALAAFLLGGGSITLRLVLPTLLLPTTASAPLQAGSGEWTAEIVDVSSPAGMEQRAFLRLSPPDANSDQWLVYAWLPRHPALVSGDRITARGTLAAPPEDAEGFAEFLRSRGAVGTLKAHAIELTAIGAGISPAIERMRWSVDASLSQAIPEPEAGLAAGILIGLRERVSRAVADDFTTTGLTHVVAISGWNIALVAGIVTALLRSTGLRRRPRSAIVIVAIVAYTLLAGAEASVIRAAAMGGVVIIARESGRPSSAAAALGVACWGLLLVEPAMIDDIGLQLSLAATAGLLALGARTESMVRRIAGNRAPRWFCEALGVSLAAQIATLPLILLHFGRLSLISPLANLLVAPIVPLAMLGAVIGSVIGPFLGPPLQLVAAPLLVAAWLPLALMTRGAELLAMVPLANVELSPPFDLAGSTLALLALSVALLRTRRGGGNARGTPVPLSAATGSRPQRRRIPALFMVVVLVAATTVALVAQPRPALQITVLDVGQGDAILLEAADGGRILIDGGPDPDLLVRRLDERIPLWDRHIDVALLTHPHEDHSGGLAGLWPRYRLGYVAETGMRSEGAGVRELRAVAARAGVHRVRLSQGDTLELGRARIEVLWPPRELLPESAPTGGRAINDTSLVLSVVIGRQRALLTGDLEEDRDEDLLAVLPRDGRRWDLLKVAHHGSATASSAPLLDGLRPRIAAISAGVENRYGHPAPSTLERLRAVGARIWRTDRDGTFSFSLRGQTRTASALMAGPQPPDPCAAPAGALPSATAEASLACYARADGRANPYRSALTAYVHVAIAATPAAHDRGSRGGVLPGLSQYASWSGHRPTPGGNSRAPP